MGHLQLAPGCLFANRFELEQVAGSRGMGTLYRAHDRHSGERVALKLLHDASGADEPQRFTREAQLLAELRHPGIVSPIAHSRTLDGQHFLAMEWLDGEDLASCAVCAGVDGQAGGVAVVP